MLQFLLQGLTIWVYSNSQITCISDHASKQNNQSERYYKYWSRCHCYVTTHAMQTINEGHSSCKNISTEAPHVLSGPHKSLNAPIDQPPCIDVTNAEFKNAIQMLKQLLVTQSIRQGIAPASSSSQGSFDTSRICEFIRINTLKFRGSKFDEDPQKFMMISKRFSCDA